MSTQVYSIHEIENRLWMTARGAELTTRRGQVVHRIVRGHTALEVLGGRTSDYTEQVLGLADLDKATLSRNETGGLTADLDGAKGRPILEAIMDPDFLK